jgi:hypothetical protein
MLFQSQAYFFFSISYPDCGYCVVFVKSLRQLLIASCGLFDERNTFGVLE